jgi:hypothetical protein
MAIAESPAVPVVTGHCSAELKFAHCVEREILGKLNGILSTLVALKKRRRFLLICSILAHPMSKNFVAVSLLMALLCAVSPDTCSSGAAR